MAERRGCGIDKGPAGHLPGRYLAAGRWSPPGRYPRQGGVPSSSSSLAAPTMTPARAALRLLPTFQKFLPRAPNGPRYARALLIWSRLFRGRNFLHFGSSPYRHHGLTDPPTTRKEHHSPSLARYRNNIDALRAANKLTDLCPPGGASTSEGSFCDSDLREWGYFQAEYLEIYPRNICRNLEYVASVD
ncbi:Uncharacterised protein [Mycobacteroides abscessus subsp. abscessus]|nr:Uncharacterised protein [Mycobacteroides abscessus subsp. abscessus]